MNLYNLKRKIMFYNYVKFPISFLIEFLYFMHNFIPCLVKKKSNLVVHALVEMLC